jgi:hypothetical protein
MATLANQGMANQMSFGQHGCAHTDSATAITPPKGKVIVAITFLADNTPTGLIAEDPSQYFNTAEAAHNESASSETQTEGSGGIALSSIKFPKGLTIYGRWTSVTPEADADGGIICYFGPANSYSVTA